MILRGVQPFQAHSWLYHVHGGGYALYGAANGSMDLGGFAGAATAGFIAGASFGNPIGVTAGMVAGGVVDRWIDS